jgi:hypothetical protein
MISRRSVLSAALALPLVGSLTARAGETGPQPEMHAAIKSLENAKKHLASATSDKGGHRGKAMRLIDQAVAHVQQGIEYDRKHGKD